VLLSTCAASCSVSSSVSGFNTISLKAGPANEKIAGLCLDVIESIRTEREEQGGPCSRVGGVLKEKLQNRFGRERRR